VSSHFFILSKKIPPIHLSRRPIFSPSHFGQNTTSNQNVQAVNEASVDIKNTILTPYNTSISVSPHTPQNSLSGIGLSFHVYELESSGKIVRKEIPRSDLYVKYALQGRDVRVLISAFNYPTVLVRRKCILVDVKNIRIIITPDRMLLFDTDSGNKEKDVISYIQTDLQYQNQQLMSSGLIEDKEDPFFLYYGSPFEFQVLESFLKLMCQEIQKEFKDLFDRVNILLLDPDLGANEEKLYELLQLKNKLNRFKNYVQEFHSALQQLLESDEDMSGLEIILLLTANSSYSNVLD
jgi:hypothetical protein